MFLKEVIESHNPEHANAITSRLQHDSVYGPYVPLDEITSLPIPVQNDCPGDNLMFHVANAGDNKGVFDVNVAHMMEEGFVGFRCHSNFSTIPQGWALDDRKNALFIYQTWGRWSREDGNRGFWSYVEPLIAISVEEAQVKCPKGVEYLSKRRTELTNQLSHIPAQQLVGVIPFFHPGDGASFDQAMYDGYRHLATGELSEELFTDYIRMKFSGQKAIDRNGRYLSTDALDEMAICFASMMCKNTVLFLMNRALYVTRNTGSTTDIQWTNEKLEAIERLKKIIAKSPTIENLLLRALACEDIIHQQESKK